jgi:beta-glucanase (GH16 family)/regulation of enolase protein 1 (concanavalin A-like superfamily)
MGAGWWGRGFGIGERTGGRRLQRAWAPRVEELEKRLVPSVLVWSDEFNGAVGSAPDQTKWTYDLGGGGWGNNELEVYTNSTQNASIVADPNATDGKALAITAIKESDGSYTSARIKTQGLENWTYGRFEARAKLPYGQGMWPAFWMLGSNIGSVGWPNSGEIDVMENIGREPSTVHGSMHGPGYSGGNALTGSYTLPNGEQFKDAYHVFDVDWTPTSVTFSVDGQVYETETTANLPQGTTWVFNHSFFVLLNLAVGGNWPGNPDGTTVFPQTYLIDYVRVYQDVPNAWSDVDVGAPGQVGGASFDPTGGTWTVAGSGADIWGTSDQFNLAAQTLAGDGTIVARVTGVQNTDPWAKAGVMLRASTNANDLFADVLATPGNGVAFEWRSTVGSQASDVHVTGLTAPVWVQLTRSGNNFSASYSTDGITWSPVGTPQTIAMPTGALAGLAVCAHTNNSLNTATFTNVSVLSAGWTATDVGAPGLPGATDFDPTTGTWTSYGGGTDIWNTSDQFQFASRSLTGDGTVVAQVTSVEATDPWAKAGVMLRASTNPNDLFADVLGTPGNGVAFEWRTTAGGQPNDVHVTGLTAPVWVQLVRAGNAFSGYYSTDGTTWTQIGTTQTFSMPTTVLAGLAVTAHNNGLLNTSTFANVAVTPAPATHFALTAPATSTAGTPLTVTLTAVDQYGNPALAYTGTVHFSSSDLQGGLPANYTFTAGDAGVHTFANAVTLKTAGAQTVTATDTVTGSITGQAGVTVSAAAATHFKIKAPASVTAGSAFSVTVTALDAYGNIAKGYLGSIHFTSSDTASGVVLPADYPFTAKDRGKHTFSGVVLETPGTQTLTATDKTNGAIKGTKKIKVTAAASFALAGFDPAALDAFFSQTPLHGDHWSRGWDDLMAPAV